MPNYKGEKQAMCGQKKTRRDTKRRADAYLKESQRYFELARHAEAGILKDCLLVRAKENEDLARKVSVLAGGTPDEMPSRG